MARIITLEQARQLPKGELRQQAYNALDCTGTLEVWQSLLAQAIPEQLRIYRFQMALQNATLSCMAKGIKVDVEARKDAIKALKAEQSAVSKAIAADVVVKEVWDGTEKDTGSCKKASRKDGKHKWPKGVPELERTCVDCGAPRFKKSKFNANSPDQCKHLFYDLLKCAPQKNKLKKISTDEDCLRRIMHKRPDLTDLIEKILSIKDLAKQLGFLECELSPNNRFMFTLTAAGTWTGRMSSKASMFKGMDGDLGSNVQNISERHRHILIPDAGYEMAYIDLAKAESHVVAYRCGDQGYIDAHAEGNDTHTFCARLIWPDYPWTGDIKKDKAIAKSSYLAWDQVEGHDIRFYSKKFQHGGNYGLTPAGISMIHKVPLSEAKVAQRNYFTEFPFIREQQEWMREQVGAQNWITNPVGRKMRFFGRPWDDATWRKALAFGPQSCVADVINVIMYRVFDEAWPTIELLAQAHDALLVQWRKEERATALRLVRKCFSLPLDIEDHRGIVRRTTIPCEVAVGLNWGHRAEKDGVVVNPKGLVELKDF
jgi:hypothetical protein